jgi:hypothetical protein
MYDDGADILCEEGRMPGPGDPVRIYNKEKKIWEEFYFGESSTDSSSSASTW